MRLSSIAALAFVVLAGSVLAQANDPADLAFWQSIQGKGPKEVQAYLNAFPCGQFAGLARVRLQFGGAAVPPAPDCGGAQVAAAAGGKPAPLGAPEAPAQPTAPVVVPAPAPAPGPDEAEATPETWTITATPPVARIGNQITLSFKDFPKSGAFDLVIVVPAGTPDLDPVKQGSDMKILDRSYSANLMDGSGAVTTWKVGPHAPGRYEARWMTGLFNDEGRLEVHARAPLAWR